MRRPLACAFLLGLVPSIAAQSSQCSCQVTNVGIVSISSGSCTEYPGGPALPCLTAAVTSVPGSPNPEPVGVGNSCGSPEVSIFFRFFDSTGLLVFEVRARYGCADCLAKSV